MATRRKWRFIEQFSHRINERCDGCYSWGEVIPLRASRKTGDKPKVNLWLCEGCLERPDVDYLVEAICQFAFYCEAARSRGAFVLGSVDARLRGAPEGILKLRALAHAGDARAKRIYEAVQSHLGEPDRSSRWPEDGGWYTEPLSTSRHSLRRANVGSFRRFFDWLELGTFEGGGGI